MKRIVFKNNRFVLQDDGAEEILLDCSDLMANKSRVPMHTLSDGETIPKLIIFLVKKHEEIRGGMEEAEAEAEAEGIGAFTAYLMDVLLVSYLIRTSAPLKAAEIGAESGVLSFHLASLMGRLNPESSLCCVSNVIGNESGNRWLNRIVMVEQPPGLSMLAADYEDTQLAADHFDIVVINGSVQLEKPYETIREAERMVKQGGIIFCYVKESPLLESCFKLIFAGRLEYEVTPDEKILIAQYDGSSWNREEKRDLKEELTGLIRVLWQEVTATDARDVVGAKSTADAGDAVDTTDTVNATDTVDARDVAYSQERLRVLLRRIDACADKAAEIYDIKRKTELLELKELVMDYMLNAGSEFERLYRERLDNYLHKNLRTLQD